MSRPPASRSKRRSQPKRLAQLAHRLEAYRPFIRASVVVTRKPCMRKETCRACKEGRKHLSCYMVASVGGKPRVRYLPKGLVAEARRRTKNFRKTKAVLEQMSDAWMEELLSRDR